MPASELTRYCAYCDDMREQCLTSVATEAERAEVMRDCPRRLATVTSVYDVPLCRACWERERKAGVVDYLEREFPAQVAAFRARLGKEPTSE
jgi:hypothetical protein